MPRRALAAEALRSVGGDVFRRGVNRAGERTFLHLRPEAGPEIVGAAAQQQIEVAALRLGESRCSGGTSIPES